MGLKELLIRGLWLTHAGGRRGTVVIIGMRSERAAAEAGVTLQQPEACHVLSWGSCPCIPGLWQWRAAQLLGGSPLVAAVAVLAFHARLWCLS